jgi:hypothetical protein
LATLNLKKRFQLESKSTRTSGGKYAIVSIRGGFHLVTSAVFADLPGAYAGDTVLNAAEFSKRSHAKHHQGGQCQEQGTTSWCTTHDWMAGGRVAAYVKARGIPLLHTLHNSFTGHVPWTCSSASNRRACRLSLISRKSTATGYTTVRPRRIKNATLINFVGQRFLEEVVHDYFTNHHFIPFSVRQEVKHKYQVGSALAIINAPSRTMYPEYCDHLIRKFGPDDDIMAAKRENLVEFQKRLGLTINPEAVLFYWPSRLDPVQKGVELLEEILLKFAIEHQNVQCAIVANGVGNDRFHEESWEGSLGFREKNRLSPLSRRSLHARLPPPPAMSSAHRSTNLAGRSIR